MSRYFIGNLFKILPNALCVQIGSLALIIIDNAKNTPLLRYKFSGKMWSPIGMFRMFQV